MVSQVTSRLKEAANLGFKRAIVPRRIRSSEAWPPGLEVIEARSLKDALKAALISN
jgi:DNA repair protein RadA/Sms